MTEQIKLNPYEARLIEAMLPLSTTDIWEQAKKEWYLTHIEEGVGNCACGKNPIKYLCFLKNKMTSNEVIVGSTCADKYLQIYTDCLFKDLAILAGEKIAFLSEQNLRITYDLQYINDWEYSFYNDIKSKWDIKKLSEKQHKIVDKIHGQVAKIIKPKEAAP